MPILRLRHTVDAATRAISDLTDRTGPLLGNVNTTVENVNTALEQVHTSLDGVNLQLARVDTMTSHAQHVTANVANLSTVVTAAAANPLVKVAAFGYGVRKAAAGRRHAEQPSARSATTLKQQRRAARRGEQLTRRARTSGRIAAMRRLLWLGIGLAVGALVVRKATRKAQAFTPEGIASSLTESAGGCVESVRSFVDDVRDGMAEREEEIHAAFAEGVAFDDQFADLREDPRIGDREMFPEEHQR